MAEALLQAVTDGAAAGAVQPVGDVLKRLANNPKVKELAQKTGLGDLQSGKFNLGDAMKEIQNNPGLANKLGSQAQHAIQGFNDMTANRRQQKNAAIQEICDIVRGKEVEIKRVFGESLQKFLEKQLSRESELGDKLQKLSQDVIEYQIQSTLLDDYFVQHQMLIMLYGDVGSTIVSGLLTDDVKDEDDIKNLSSSKILNYLLDELTDRQKRGGTGVASTGASVASTGVASTGVASTGVASTGVASTGTDASEGEGGSDGTGASAATVTGEDEGAGKDGKDGKANVVGDGSEGSEGAAHEAKTNVVDALTAFMDNGNSAEPKTGAEEPTAKGPAHAAEGKTDVADGAPTPTAAAAAPAANAQPAPAANHIPPLHAGGANIQKGGAETPKNIEELLQFFPEDTPKEELNHKIAYIVEKSVTGVVRDTMESERIQDTIYQQITEQVKAYMQEIIQKFAGTDKEKETMKLKELMLYALLQDGLIRRRFRNAVEDAIKLSIKPGNTAKEVGQNILAQVDVYFGTKIRGGNAQEPTNTKIIGKGINSVQGGGGNKRKTKRRRTRKPRSYRGVSTSRKTVKHSRKTRRLGRR